MITTREQLAGAASLERSAAPSVVHVVDPETSGQEPLLGAAKATSIGGFAHHAWVIGGTRSEELAWAYGLRTTDRVVARRARGPLSILAGLDAIGRLGRAGVRGAAMGFRRAGLVNLARARFGAQGRTLAEPDVVVAWSTSAAALARATFASECPLLLMCLRGPDGESIERVLRLRGPIMAGAFSPAIAHAWREAGVPGVMMIDPPALVDPRWGERRAVARASLGIGDDELTIALLADPVARGDARLFSWLIGVVHVAGRHALGVMPAGASQSRRAARYLRLHGRSWDVLRTEGSSLAMLHAADVGVWGCEHPSSPGAGGWLLARALGCNGVPVVATDQLGAGELLASEAWCVVREATMPSFAKALLPLADDAALRARVGASLRAALGGADGVPRIGVAGRDGSAGGAGFESTMSACLRATLSLSRATPVGAAGVRS